MKNEMITEPVKGSDKYIKTELGLIPSDWGIHKIQSLIDRGYIVGHLDGNHGALYPRSHEFSIDGVPYVAATDFINGNVDFRTCKHLPIERALIFQKGFAKNGDVLFAHNATVGPVAFLSTSENFVILSTTATYYRTNNQKLLNKYLFYYLQSSLFKIQYSSIMAQSTRSQVPITTQRKLDVILPPLPDQTAIAEALSDADAMIASLEKLIEKKKKIKQGAMQELLSSTGSDGKLKEGWVKRKLGECLSYEQPGNYIVKSTDYNDNNQTPVLTAGKSFILGYTDEEFGIFTNLPVIIFDDFTTASKYVSFPFKVKSSAMKILKCKGSANNIRFLFELMQGIDYPMGIGDHKRHWIGEYQQIEIIIPEIREQNRIASILQEMDDEITLLESMLSKSILVKQGMMQNLLTGKIRLV